MCSLMGGIQPLSKNVAFKLQLITISWEVLVCSRASVTYPCAMCVCEVCVQPLSTSLGALSPAGGLQEGVVRKEYPSAFAMQGLLITPSTGREIKGSERQFLGVGGDLNFYGEIIFSFKDYRRRGYLYVLHMDGVLVSSQPVTAPSPDTCWLCSRSSLWFATVHMSPVYSF